MSKTGSRERTRRASRCAPAVLALLACLTLLAATRPPMAPTGPAQRAFYYWRTRLVLSDAERRALAEQQIDRLYVRMFDVDAQGELIGRLSVPEGERVPGGVEVVPVVFVRQEVFRGASPGLAQRSWAEVQRRMQALGAVPRELQLDCDWTESTQGAFFAFVRELRALASPVAISATIRLHQVKYRERTGVPPVERGMLMFYNMGSFTAEAGAIFDAERAKDYLARVDEYPLPLDVALPLWSWVVQLRDGAVQGLLESTDPDELTELDFLAREAPDRFVVARSAFLHGHWLRAGDVLKLELTGPAQNAERRRARAAASRGGSPHGVALRPLGKESRTP